PAATPFPYTTLFRSIRMGLHARRSKINARCGHGGCDGRRTPYASNPGKLPPAEQSIHQLSRTRKEPAAAPEWKRVCEVANKIVRSEEHTSELQSHLN